MNYNIINTVRDDYFVHPNGLAFDFRSKSDVTFIMFMGGISKKYFDIKQRLDFWRKLIHKNSNIDPNVIIVADVNENTVYEFNFHGIDGICNDIWELSKIILDKLYLQGTTKKTIIYGDCGAAIPIALSSTIVPYHSMILTTPYFTVLGSEHEFDTGQYSVWHSKQISVHNYNKNQNYKNYFDTLNYFDEFTKNHTNLLNLHWATNIIGTDLLFRHKANSLPKRSNISIVDHTIPNKIEGHILSSYLFSTGKLQSIVTEQIKIQKNILDTNFSK